MTIREATDASPPTDLELMLHADGELEGERLGVVEAFRDDSAVRAKLASLAIVSEVVRERALEASAAAGADGIADAVMGLIDAEVPAETPAAARPTAKVAPAVPKRAAHESPANDNSRGFYLIAAGVVAAAAAMLLWIRQPAPSGGLATPQGSAAVAPAVRTAPVVEAARTPEPEGDVEHGVEVASVDFGSRTGAVFYVPTGTSSSSTTTVVWLSENSAGEN